MGFRGRVAEDEALIALSLADLVEAEGHEVVLAPDGADALDSARRLGGALDVLVTDLNMPRLAGEDLIRELRAERPGLPVVVVTGSAPFGGAEALRRRAGGDGPLLLLLRLPGHAELAAALGRSAAAAAGRSAADRTAAGQKVLCPRRSLICRTTIARVSVPLGNSRSSSASRGPI